MTVGAVLWEPGSRWDVTELEIDEPQAHEVLIRYEAAGLCYSDEHVRSGEQAVRYPIVGGHEGAGIVEQIGLGVTRVNVGDHVVCSFVPSCGHCYWCLVNARHLCTTNSDDGTGSMQDGTYRRHIRGIDVGAYDILGAFSRHGVVAENACIPIPAEIPLEVACIASCAVPTGWGAAAKVADVQLGDTVVVHGVGGVGLNALQGARLRAAKNIVAVDNVEKKRELAMKCGATFFTTSSEEMVSYVQNATQGRGADVAILATGTVTSSLVVTAFTSIRRRGTVVLVGVGAPSNDTIQLPGFQLTVDEKRVTGTLYGSCNPAFDIPILLDLYRSGHLILDELVTARYDLADINIAYKNLVDGEHVGRGIIVYS